MGSLGVEDRLGRECLCLCHSLPSVTQCPQCPGAEDAIGPALCPSMLPVILSRVFFLR